MFIKTSKRLHTGHKRLHTHKEVMQGGSPPKRVIPVMARPEPPKEKSGPKRSEPERLTRWSLEKDPKRAGFDL